MKKITALLTILITFNICAEYRVYQYHIRSRSPSSISKDPYLVTSTLHPQAYLAYHGGHESLEVDLLRSWMCYGNTSLKETCPPPLNQKAGKNNEN